MSESPSRREIAWWGLLGGLAFLVLYQGYVLTGGPPFSLAVVGVVSVAVAIGSAVGTAVLGRHLSSK